jgi:hypothetical protein
MSNDIASMITKISTNKGVPEILQEVHRRLNFDDNKNPTGLQRQFKNENEACEFWNDIILNFSKGKSYKIDSFWINMYKTGDEQGWHRHTDSDDVLNKFTIILFLKFDPAIHRSTCFALDSTGLGEYEPLDIQEGDCIIFPSTLYHKAPANESTELRAVSVVNFYILND